jgi:hypothetical protein
VKGTPNQAVPKEVKMQPVFIDTGPFWDKYPEAEPEIMRYVVRNEDGSVAEVWERNDDGFMVCTYEEFWDMDEIKKRNNKKKLIIVYVLNVLRLTSKGRPVTQTVISDYLNEIGIPCDRKTVGRNVEYLKEMGYPIVKVPNVGMYFDHENFVADEKRFVL